MSLPYVKIVEYLIAHRSLSFLLLRTVLRKNPCDRCILDMNSAFIAHKRHPHAVLSSEGPFQYFGRVQNTQAPTCPSQQTYFCIQELGRHFLPETHIAFNIAQNTQPYLIFLENSPQVYFHCVVVDFRSNRVVFVPFRKGFVKLSLLSVLFPQGRII